ncbi:MAG TPA: IS4 family transposase, partial [Tepidisphaeraceae bacterium]|nr:IS4 family transposase [Tepidisphaeraceae bacterium]
WRDRVLSPLVTLRLFLLQVLHGNTSITHLRQLSGLSFAPGSYCEARERLPLAAIVGLLDTLRQWAERHVRRDPTRLGPRVLVANGSTFSTPDTKGLRSHLGIYPGAKAGVAYPMGKLLGLLDAASGLFVELLATPLLSHEAGQVTRVHPLLRAGDVLLGDRAFCSFVHVALLNACGVLACFHLHQRRKAARGARRQRWAKPPKAPLWMNPLQFALLPAWVDVRLVSYAVNRPGFRTTHVTVATTLDEDAWPDAAVAALYGKRWEIETCFDHLKTTMGMNMLKCKSVQGVTKELAMYLLAYNLVRLAMLKAAARQGVAPSRVSFVDAMRWLACRMLGLAGVDTLIVNPNRHGRCQLRVIRRRMKAYDLLVRPREQMKSPRQSGGNT